MNSAYRKLGIVAVIFLIIGFAFGSGIAYLKLSSAIESSGREITSLKAEVLSLENQLNSLKDKLERESEKIGNIEEAQLSISEAQANITRTQASLAPLLSFKSEEQRIIEVYEKVSPGVVYITTERVLRGFFGEELVQQGAGSGFIVSKEGYILTNNHVIENAENVWVGLSNGKIVKAEIIGTDPATDIAVLKIDPSEVNFTLKPVVLGDSDKLKVGMKVIAIGNPFNLQRTATLGIISALNRSIETEAGTTIKGVIQTDASINPGNSGGPLVNLDGEVIGVNTAIISPVRGSIGIGFAIPINTAKKIMNELIEHGKVIRGWLGITGISVNAIPEEIRAEMNISVDYGVLIVDVVENSPAKKAGLKGSNFVMQINDLTIAYGGDIILSVDGIKMQTAEQLANYISNKKPGEKVEIIYLRDGEEHEVSVILGERPS